ncbi:MAG: PilZ domain-containing protein [Phycisphaeraceae bacterium]|nr:PilZ domain-containing protein [Phycisphaeraceae bacterium]
MGAHREADLLTMHPRKFGRVVCQFVGTSLGDVVDMSAGGMRVSAAAAAPVKVDDVVQLKLVGISEVVFVRCRVAWVKESAGKQGWTARLKRLVGGTRREIGLEFFELTPEARRVIGEIGAAAGKNETIRPDIERFREQAA